jgi:DNA (cytosine-5)-methyltransferase 1
MTKEIILLDGCCSAGGAGYGYYQAAQKLGIKITIIGVDVKPQPNYPTLPGFEFVQDDLLSFIDKNHKKFTHLHASPPCQNYSVASAQFIKKGKVYLDILEPVKQRFASYKQPCVIENVLPAPLRQDIILRGDMFGLGVLKARAFQLDNWFMMAPCRPMIKGSVRGGDYCTVVGKGNLTSKKGFEQYKHHRGSIKENWRYSTGNHWMQTYKELAESIPWKYTEYIGEQFFKTHIKQKR